MTKRGLGKRQRFSYNLTSLNSQINEWNNLRSTSPVLKSSKGPTQNFVVSSREASQTHSSDSDTMIGKGSWYEKICPRCLEDVAIHKRKLDDVRQKLIQMLKDPESCRILLLTGPSGTSKSTLIKQLGRILVPMYKNNNRLYGIYGSNEKDGEGVVVEYCNDLVINELSQVKNFQEFLSQSKYRVGSNLSIILVEDFPNLFHDGTRVAFQQALLEWLYSTEEQLPPLVISLTESEIESSDSTDKNYLNIDTMFTAETLLGREILNHPKLQRIKFNPINNTLLKKTLSKICIQEQNLLKLNDKWTQRTEITKEIASSTGDIRSAISALEFWAMTKSNIGILTRKEPVSFFHAVGKVIHGSHDIEDDNEMLNSLLGSSTSLLSNENFKLGLLENYASFNRGSFDLMTASKIVDTLSESNTLRDFPESTEYLVRKVRYSFASLKSEDHHHGKAAFSREWKVRQSTNRFKLQFEDFFNVSFYKYNATYLFKDVVSDLGYYSPLIRKQQNYKKRSLLHYISTLSSREAEKIVQKNADTFQVDDTIDITERLGGSILLVAQESSMVTEDDTEKENIKSLEFYRKLRDDKLRKLLLLKQREDYQIDSEDEEYKMMMEDSIEDSDEEKKVATNLAEEDDDDSLFEILSQRNLIPKEVPNDESLSDSDLEEL
ncbi:hypothetical protein KAFR_0B02590 [Kazachstania africana CBS 2517]|uniref:Checkpoint protein RAD24-like helical bundle domain-containing protein n=1 Tax=Kazachstania africana (strain ATCC 22294 / BCRC 22015 / CBS 2517 / CECT 1963 / NBRC 1671 / NRRL Y-8276) TaxID=1071382 RepID=H2AQA6_KAZAF|nr:hypothetical protein KAFR_0B02590 [Kazachstania africana CBS 2517]CCF56556.1 hypothetical protein KAFR_0B02590 [Kazachstania africana CBS 2517]